VSPSRELSATASAHNQRLRRSLRRSIYAFVTVVAGWGAATLVYRNVNAWGQGLSTETLAPIVKVEQDMSDGPAYAGFCFRLQSISLSIAFFGTLMRPMNNGKGLRRSPRVS
jgi:hypothetical protein